nr:MAG TPA: hypothetical protein [Bacteriophage sp.]
MLCTHQSYSLKPSSKTACINNLSMPTPFTAWAQ